MPFQKLLTAYVKDEDIHLFSEIICTDSCTEDQILLQLHAAVVELSAAKGAEIKYSTVQNWFSGDENGVGGIYNFVTKRGICQGDNSKISWTQVSSPQASSWCEHMSVRTIWQSLMDGKYFLLSGPVDVKLLTVHLPKNPLRGGG